MRDLEFDSLAQTSSTKGQSKAAPSRMQISGRWVKLTYVYCVVIFKSIYSVFASSLGFQLFIQLIKCTNWVNDDLSCSGKVEIGARLSCRHTFQRLSSGFLYVDA